MKYTKKEILTAGKLGEISMIDVKHLISLLDEAREDINEMGEREMKIKKRKPKKHKIKCTCGKTIIVKTNIYDNINSGQATCECGAVYIIN